MRNTFFLLLIFVAVSMLVSCEAGDTGNFKIRLRLPIDDGVCQSYGDEEEDYTYCITNSDQILLSIYSTLDPSEPYVYADRKLIRVDSLKGFRGGKEEFVRSLKKGTYYRFFVEVTNVNEKLKLTGGIDGIYYDDDSNYEVDIFLGAVGDFVRVVGDRKDYDETSMRSYFDSAGSKGAAAVAIKGGKLYLSGGYSFDNERTMNNTMIFNLSSVSSEKAANLPQALTDHAAAFLDDNSESGKVVVAFGTVEDDGYSNEIIVFDPEKGKYRNLGFGDSVTRAKALTIDGDVYIVGGCNKTANSKKIYKINKLTYAVEDFATLTAGRCNHSVADVSTVGADGKVIPRILVLGGSVDENGENPVLTTSFAEIATFKKSVPVELSDRNGGDVSEILTKGLVSAGAVSIKMDDKEVAETIVTVVGGYLQDGEGDTKALITSLNLYVLSEAGENKWVYDVNGAPFECARPSVGVVGVQERSTSKYAAVNCGNKEYSRTGQSASDQIIFVVQVKRTFDVDLGIDVFSASGKDTLMEESRDTENGIIVDGPIAVNELGQAFIFGTEFVYQVSSYSIP